MKKIILFLCLFCVYQYVTAQQIKNVKARQQGEEIIINYELVADDDNQTFVVSVQLYEGETPDYIPKNRSLRGDVGENITRGKKQIIWAITEDIQTLKGDNFVFKVKARYTQKPSKPIPKEKPSEPINTQKTYTETIKGINFKMIYVEGGTFTIGCTTEQGDNCQDREKITKQITLNNYYMAETEVTQKLWKTVMGTNPSSFKDCDNCPVENVSYNEIINYFLPKLNKLTRKTYILPSEAQWEYAARGGKSTKKTKYSGSNNLIDVTWYYDNSGSKTHPVGQLSPNELGIYDMSGNVWEWCKDWYVNSYADYPDASSGTHLVYRGGSWVNFASYCRVTYRDYSAPSDKFTNLGLRLCRVDSL